ncbi:6400_t:CDS:2 [Entrophospora sp. SA101]|nr:6400_t:CDS:2 [Entrophospora sp. SA101]
MIIESQWTTLLISPLTMNAILHWEQASEVAIEWASKAFAILQTPKHNDCDYRHQC